MSRKVWGDGQAMVALARSSELSAAEARRLVDYATEGFAGWSNAEGFTLFTLRSEVLASPGLPTAAIHRALRLWRLQRVDAQAVVQRGNFDAYAAWLLAAMAFRSGADDGLTADDALTLPALGSLGAVHPAVAAATALVAWVGYFCPGELAPSARGRTWGKLVQLLTELEDPCRTVTLRLLPEWPVSPSVPASVSVRKQRRLPGVFGGSQVAEVVVAAREICAPAGYFG